MRYRSSGVAPLFLGTDGLTDAQQRELDALLERQKLAESDPKKKLTDNMLSKLNELIDKRDAEPSLSQGAKTYIEEIVDQEVYEYTPSFDNKATNKGNECEDQTIELYNSVFFTDHKKLVEGDKYYSLKYGLLTGHPDVVCEMSKKVKDAKSSWSKSTFPKTPEKAYNSKYEWQVKSYLYMLIKITGDDSWRHGEVFHGLVSTPEGMVPDWEDPSEHYADNLDPNLRLTVNHVELTDADIKHMEKRMAMGEKYANEYRELLKSKNK